MEIVGLSVRFMNFGISLLRSRTPTVMAACVLLASGRAVVGQDAPEEEPGQLAYQMNCMACHLIETQVVGPSLVTVAATYPEEKRSEFIAWAKAPGKKDPRLLQMPPMAHIPEETLVSIHDYILKATVGKKEKRRSALFTPFKEPVRELPYVVRAFLPDSSPASVGVILKDDISLCWDTEACRFRYVWKGSETRLKGGHSVAKLKSEPYYREDADQLWSLEQNAKPEFHGYRLIGGYPVFEYSIGEVNIAERITNGPAPGSFSREFTLSRPVPELKLTLNPTSEALVSSDKGEFADGILTLSGADTQSFTLTISRP